MDDAVVDELVRELRELEAGLFASQLPGSPVDLPPRYLAVRSLLQAAPGLRVEDVSAYDQREGRFRAEAATAGLGLDLDEDEFGGGAVDEDDEASGDVPRYERQVNSDGVAYGLGRRKKSQARVNVWRNEEGKGKMAVNGKGAGMYFLAIKELGM